MSTQIETIFDYQASVGKRNGAQKAKQQDDSNTAAAFAAFMTQNTANNSSFMRLNAQLDLPQSTSQPQENFAAQDRNRPDTTNSDHDAFDGHGDDAPLRDRTADRARDTAIAARANDKNSTPAQNTDTSKAAGTAVKPDDANSRPAANANGNAAQGQATAKAASQAQQAGQATPQAPAQASTTEAAVNANKAATGTPTPNAPLPTSDNSLKAAVTTQGGQVTSQPSNTLSAESSVMAEAGEGSGTNVFTKANSQGGNGNGNGNGQQNQNTFMGQNPKGGADGAAAAGNGQQQQPQPSLPGVGFNNAIAAAAAQPGVGREAVTANLAGSSGQIASTDALTGATMIEGQNGSTQRASAPAASHARRPQVPPQVIADQVAVNIQRAAGQGMDRINIQLRPQELGRIDVKMEMTHDGRMTAVISAEKPETLEMLRSDARNLIQTLNDAGLQTDADSLNFSLQGQDGADQQQFAGNGRGSGNSNNEEFSLEDAPMLSDDSPLLGDGEDVTLDQDGHLNVRV